ncbi:molybdopterin-binding protein [uncultured Chryseobacterium sp.]|uniref:molybdopterin-binding protein n=1 Tax=uncultured Chryseobacterium sp. TaxID=259322 RepID=UPI0025E39C0C|nr:molybdopterin-binding protein [uncultured Chryseobacterium sp.]
MKYFATIFVFLTVFLQAQKSSVRIKGAISNPVTVTYEDLKKYTEHEVKSIDILNHKMEFKKNLKNLKGVLLKDVLSQVTFNSPSPKELSTFYMVCTADDGYKVVYSWNEVFNTEAGDRTMLVTGENGIPTSGTKDGIILITPEDRATGRRYVKNISEITIKKVD